MKREGLFPPSSMENIMQYIVVKPFAFAGDQYKAGDVFDPAKYPYACDSRKLERMVRTRRVVEDFKIVPKPDSQQAVEAPSEAPETLEKKNVKRSKAE